MAAVTSLPASSHPDQKTADWSDLYFTRYIPTWNRPTISSAAWRNVVSSRLS